LWALGFRGNVNFKSLKGKFNEINREDITPKHPWYVKYEESKITPAGKKATQGGTLTCVSWRNYITTWSDFNLVGNTQIRANFGFRVYQTDTSENAISKGYAENVTLYI